MDSLSQVGDAKIEEVVRLELVIAREVVAVGEVAIIAALCWLNVGEKGYGGRVV